MPLRAGSQRRHFATWKELFSLRVNKPLLAHSQTLIANLRYVACTALYTQKGYCTLGSTKFCFLLLVILLPL